jgi:multimeric flavodoxin WrbA
MRPDAGIFYRPLDDDYTTVVDAILAADAPIMAVPTDFLGCNGCLKRFTDRGLVLEPHREALGGKPGVAAGLANDNRAKENAYALSHLVDPFDLHFSRASPARGRR